MIKYEKGFFRDSHNSINFITYDNKIVIPEKLQKYVLKWYHTHPLHPVPDITEAMTIQHLYWTEIREYTKK